MKNIVLIGFMASGKTVIGQNLAQQIGYSFVDIDSELEKKLNLSIKQIHDQYPLEQINDLEQETVNDVYILKKQLIALNMKAVFNDHLMRVLKHNSIIIFLKTDLQHCICLAMEDEEKNKIYRLIINKYNQVNRFQKCKKYSVALRLLTDLNLLFEQYKDYYIDVRDKPISLIVTQLCEYLSKTYKL